jgi:hypothetical protein
MPFDSLSSYERITKRCRQCRWRLFEASNQVRFCMYCDWLESDQERFRRLGRVST